MYRKSESEYDTSASLRQRVVVLERALYNMQMQMINHMTPTTATGNPRLTFRDIGESMLAKVLGIMGPERAIEWGLSDMYGLGSGDKGVTMEGGIGAPTLPVTDTRGGDERPSRYAFIAGPQVPLDTRPETVPEYARMCLIPNCVRVGIPFCNGMLRQKDIVGVMSEYIARITSAAAVFLVFYRGPDPFDSYFEAGLLMMLIGGGYPKLYAVCGDAVLDPLAVPAASSSPESNIPGTVNYPYTQRERQMELSTICRSAMAFYAATAKDPARICQALDDDRQMSTMVELINRVGSGILDPSPVLPKGIALDARQSFYNETLCSCRTDVGVILSHIFFFSMYNRVSRVDADTSQRIFLMQGMANGIIMAHASQMTRERVDNNGLRINYLIHMMAILLNINRRQFDPFHYRSQEPTMTMHALQ